MLIGSCFDQKYLKRTKSDNRSSSVPLYPFQSYATIKAIMIDRRYSPCRFPFPILPLRISPLPRFSQAPDAVLVPSPQDKVAPEQYHATTIFPEYFKIGGQWLLAKESRMDCVAVYENGNISIREFRRLKKGDLVVVGRTEDASEGIFVYLDGFSAEESGSAEAFSFRQGRSRETAYSRDYDSLYDLLRHEKEHGYITWVLGYCLRF